LKIANIVKYLSINHEKKKDFVNQRLQGNLQRIEATTHYIWN